MNCKKHNRLIVATLDVGTPKEKQYCIDCIKELKSKYKYPPLGDVLSLLADAYQSEFLAWIKENIHTCVDGYCPKCDGCTELEWS